MADQQQQQLRAALAVAIVRSKKERDAQLASCQQRIGALEAELQRSKAATAALYKLVRRHVAGSTQQPAGRQAGPGSSPPEEEAAGGSHPVPAAAAASSQVALYASGLAEVQAQLAALGTSGVAAAAGAELELEQQQQQQQQLEARATSMAKLLQHLQLMRVAQAAQQRAGNEREQGLALELLDAPQHRHVCSFVVDVLLQMPASDVRAAYMSACATTLAALLQAGDIAAAPAGAGSGGIVGAHVGIR
jgi:hypothetical protein